VFCATIARASGQYHGTIIAMSKAAALGVAFALGCGLIAIIATV
jgi:hypothetical protein